MIPCGFAESNMVLQPPDGVPPEQCCPLSALCVIKDDEPAAIFTCWKLTKEEMEEVKKTGRVWLMVVPPHPMLWVSGKKPFKLNEGTGEVKVG